jgi:hypothetical protein
MEPPPVLPTRQPTIAPRRVPEPVAVEAEPVDTAPPPPEQPPYRKPTEEVIRPTRAAPPVPQPTEAQPGDLICGNCGTPNDPRRHFCKTCGRSLATAVPVRKPPWWRRFFPERRALAAGERTGRIRRAESGRRGGFGRLLRTVIAMLLVVGIAFVAVGYAAVPAIQRQVNGLIRSVAGRFAQPIQVYPVRGAASAILPEHGPALVFDKSFNLYWAAPLDGSMPWVELTFNQETDIAALLVTPGAFDAMTEYARPKEIRITFSDGTSVTRTLEDATLVNGDDGNKRIAAQTVDVSGDATTFVKIEIVSVYEGTRPAVAVAEVEVFAKP